MEVLLLIPLVWVAWLASRSLCKPTPHPSHSHCTLRFPYPLPAKMYGKDLREAYWLSTIEAYNAQFGALVGWKGSSIDEQVADVMTDEISGLLLHGMVESELYDIGDIGEFKAAGMIVTPRFAHDRTYVKLWLRPAAAREVVH